MVRQDNPSDPAAELRQRAQAQLSAMPAANLETLTPEQARQLLHELQVHQIELEMQNEELRRSQEALELVRAGYFDLYEFAPVGYVTLNEQGLILQANLRTATLLGVARDELIQQPLSRFIVPEDEDEYYLSRRRLSANHAMEVCELRMRGTPTAQVLWVRLTMTLGEASGSTPPLWRITLSDINTQKLSAAAFRSTHQRLEALVSNLYAGVLFVGNDGKIEYMNQAFCDLFDLSDSTASLMALTLSERSQKFRTAYANLDEALARIREIHAAGQPVHGEEIAMTRGRTYLRDFIPIDVDGKRQGRLWFFQDISERKRAEENLKRSENLMRLVADNLPEFVAYVSAPDLQYRFVNRQYEIFFERSREQIVGQSVSQILSPPNYEFAKPYIERALSGETCSYENTFLFGGEPRWIQVHFVPDLDERGAVHGVVILNYDITESKQLEENLRAANLRLSEQLAELQKLHLLVSEQAIRDPLTHLYNRRYLNETLPREIALALRQNYTIGVLMIDIDHFKTINDTFGHLAGDETLQIIARTMTLHVRASDIVCRYGGEEFLCLLMNSTEENTLQRAEQLCAAIAGLEIIAAHPTARATVSIGAALLPLHGKDTYELLKSADQALYHAKADGRNCVRLAR